MGKCSCCGTTITNLSDGLCTDCTKNQSTLEADK